MKKIQWRLLFMNDSPNIYVHCMWMIQVNVQLTSTPMDSNITNIRIYRQTCWIHTLVKCTFICKFTVTTHNFETEGFFVSMTILNSPCWNGWFLEFLKGSSLDNRSWFRGESNEYEISCTVFIFSQVSSVKTAISSAPEFEECKRVL